MTRILEVKTIQSRAFQILIESLKDILTDVNIEFSRREVVTENGEEKVKNKGGMKIIAMNAKKSILIHLRLYAENFDVFKCEKPKIIVSLNMLNFYKLIKTIDTSSILTLFMDSDETGRLGIKIENAERKMVSVYKLGLMDLEPDKLTVPPTSFDAVITIPSTDFYKLCKDMSLISDFIEIQNAGKSVILKGEGDIAKQETVLGETINGLSVSRDENNTTVVQGKYELKNLVMFTKCTSLCPSIDIYMKNDYPLVIHYQVASLGDIYLCIAPHAETEDDF
jgi:proliferating cell nuclear antigen PCNA